MPAVGSLPAALSAASRLRQAIESPFRLGDVDVDVDVSVSVSVSVSVGVAVSDSSMTDAATLPQQADSAMYAAKQQQHLGVAPYSVGDESSSPQRLAMLGELRRGLSAWRAGSALSTQGQPVDR
jgi:diguanylate cyclase